MPADPGNGFNQDIPAIWALNAKIPRTAQYGACSCWDTGCGEFDLFEVLTDATKYIKSHYHASQGSPSGKYGGGGSTDYFNRPYDATVKAAAIFDESGTVTVKLLPAWTRFSATVDLSVIEQGAEKASVYKVPS